MWLSHFFESGSAALRASPSAVGGGLDTRSAQRVFPAYTLREKPFPSYFAPAGAKLLRRAFLYRPHIPGLFSLTFAPYCRLARRITRAVRSSVAPSGESVIRLRASSLGLSP